MDQKNEKHRCDNHTNKKHDHCTKKNNPELDISSIVLRTDAIQRSTDLVGELALQFAATVSAPFAQQPALVSKLVKLFTTRFTFSIIFPNPSENLIATDYTSLLAIVRSLSGGGLSPVYTQLVGSLTVKNYDCSNHKRFVDMRGTQSTFETALINPPSPTSAILIYSNDYEIVEKCRGVFKIKTYTSTLQTGSVIPPFNSPVASTTEHHIFRLLNKK